MVGREPSTVPDIEQEIAQKLDSFLVDVNGGAQPANVLCDVIAEDDAAHR